MWVFTKYGFYSVVESKFEAGKLAIRTRDRKHLNNLQPFLKKVNAASEHGVEVYESADYPYRITLSPKVWASVMEKLTLDIDYENFKNVAETRKKKLGPLFVKALHDIWGLLWDAATNKRPS